jgi:hypothetical protein
MSRFSFLGIFFILPCIDAYARVDLRTRTYDVPPQELSILHSFSSSMSLDVLRNDLSDSAKQTPQMTILFERINSATNFAKK